MAQGIYALGHALTGFLRVHNPYHESGLLKNEGLQVRTFGTVVDGIHLRRRSLGVCGDESEIILIAASLVVGGLLALPVLFLGLFTLNLLLEGEVVHAVSFEDASLYVGVYRPVALCNLRMGGQNLVDGLTFPKQGCDGLADLVAFFLCEVYALS